MIKCKEAKEGLCPEGKTICCFTCSSLKTCKEACADAFNLKETATECADAEEIADSVVTLDMLVPHFIADVTKASIVIKKQEAKIKVMKDAILKAMEENNIKKYSNDWIEITYVAPTTSKKIDSKALKSKYPQIAEECTSISDVKSQIRIKVKDE